MAPNAAENRISSHSGHVKSNHRNLTSVCAEFCSMKINSAAIPDPVPIVPALRVSASDESFLTSSSLMVVTLALASVTPIRNLFCTAHAALTHGDQIRAVVPGIELIELHDDTPVSDADIARIDAAFFSADAYPERAPAFMTVCLSAPTLRWLHSYSAGTDHAVFTMLAERGVLLTNSPGASAGPIAETVMMYLLALTRRLPEWFDAQRSRVWAPHDITELADARLAVVGMGSIGLEVIRRAQAFEMDVVGVRRTVTGDEPCPTRTMSELSEVVSDVDAVVSALPLTDETRSLFDRTLLSAMQPGTLFINVGRGESVDEDALVDLLDSGHLGGAALDVFATEPLAETSALWSMPTVIVTPHSSGASNRTGERAAAIFIDLLGRHAAGDELTPAR